MKRMRNVAQFPANKWRSKIETEMTNEVDIRASVTDTDTHARATVMNTFYLYTFRVQKKKDPFDPQSSG